MKRIAATVAMLGSWMIAGCAARHAADVPARMTDVPMFSTSAEPAETAPTSQPAANQPALPKGHPDISSLMGGQQAPAPSDMPALPKGHPDISKLAGSTTQPVAGSLVVRAVQGTAGCPAVGADPVTVEVYGSDHLIGKLETKLEADGSVRIDNIPTGPGYQVIAHVTHAGVDFDATCEASSSAVQLSVPVYETTDQKPDWSIHMRHAIVQPADDGLHVMEVVAIQNPGDRAWLGDAPAADGKRTTFAFPLPAGASSVQLGGAFHGDSSKVADGKIINATALLPGVTQYQFNYVVPINAGKAELIMSAPAPVKTMMLLLPEGIIGTADGLEGPKTVNMGNGNTQYFKASDLPANKQVKLSINVTATKGAKGTAAANDAFDPATAAKAIGGVGAILVVLLGGAFLVMKSPRRVRSQASHS